MKHLLLLALFAAAVPGGLTFTHRASPTAQKYLPETMGGGVALLDYNNDGRLDILLVNGGRLTDSLAPPTDFARGEPAYWNRLYRQNPDGTFTDVTKAAGLSSAANAYGMGVATGDYDNDGFPDLYLTGYGGNQLYHNNGNGTFTDVTEAAGVAASGWSVSAGFLDYDNDGRLDLFVSRYLDYRFADNISCGAPARTYCRPDHYAGRTNLLFHNEGNGRFRDVSEASRVSAVTGKGMGVAFHDYDQDGRPDIFVSNDLMEQFLFHNRGDGTFDEVALTASVALNDDGKAFSGMGAAFADYDNDDRPDILVTNLAQERWALYHNDGHGAFTYATLASGLGELTVRSSGWGVGLHDFDNDGWKDIFAAQGHVLDNVERLQAGLFYREPPVLYRNGNGRFEKAILGPLPAVAGRGAAFGDLDNDGTLDAVIATLNGPPLVIHGRRGVNHWLTLRLIGARSPRDGQGALVRIGQQTVYATTAGSYLSASDPRVHFGLGPQTRRVTVEISWPSGVRQTVTNIAADQILTVKEPAE